MLSRNFRGRPPAKELDIIGRTQQMEEDAPMLDTPFQSATRLAESIRRRTIGCRELLD